MPIDGRGRMEEVVPGFQWVWRAVEMVLGAKGMIKIQDTGG